MVFEAVQVLRVCGDCGFGDLWRCLIWHCGLFGYPVVREMSRGFGFLWTSHSYFFGDEFRVMKTD